MQTVITEKVDGKKWPHLHGIHVSFLTYMVVKLAKKGIFYNFVLTSAKILSMLKQFMYTHLKWSGWYRSET